MKSINCLSLIALICTSTLVNGRSICVGNSKSTSTSNDKVEYSNNESKAMKYINDPEDMRIEKLKKRITECQDLFENIPEDYDIGKGETVYGPKYYKALAIAACEKDGDNECPITDYLRVSDGGKKDVKLSSYIIKSCESSKCFDNLKEFATFRTDFLLYMVHGESRSTYKDLEKEEKENKAFFEKCYEKNPSFHNDEYFNYDIEDMRIETFKKNYGKCIVEDFSNDSVSNFCNNVYQSKECQDFYENDPEEYDADNKYLVHGPNYYKALAKAVCEKDDDNECPVSEYLHASNGGKKDVKLSSYITKSCESSKCLDNMKEFANARSELYKYLIKGSDRSAYYLLEDEEKENKALFEKCSN